MNTPEIRGTTRLLGLIGDPVTHSFSPTMHNAALVALGLDAVYVPLEVHPENLEAAVRGLQACGWWGFNVTIPHKQAIVPFLDRLESPAHQVGVVNTVRIETDGSLTGTNTDAEGFVQPLTVRQWIGKTALILGCGGSAFAVVAGCQALGFDQIFVVGRNSEKLKDFAARLPNPQGVKTADWFMAESLLPRADLLVNTTPIGMVPDIENSPLENLKALSKGAIVYDLIYRPRPTRLLQIAQSGNLVCIDGLAMLVAQGAAALQFWTGKVPPIEIMTQAALRALE
ncbi:MAG: shikimate dehydrogenase [Anaerolineae bacterium]|nr:shikimate dehydrogenase [Gloeobacterales cyanobacterium ES-bin-313]